MQDLDTIYTTTDPAPINDALSEAATQTRKAFTSRADKHGIDDETCRLLAIHKRLIALRRDMAEFEISGRDYAALLTEVAR